MTILWQTGFEFASDSLQTSWAASPPGDSLARAGDWFMTDLDDPAPKLESSITTGAAAIHGTRGLQGWMGDENNSLTGTLGIDFATAGLAAEYTEMWIRWYFKYQAGFRWLNDIVNHKMVYLSPILPGWAALGFYNGVLGVQGPLGSAWQTSATTWSAAFCGGVGNDAIEVARCLEYHVKLDTNGADGLLDIWLDGTLIHSRTDAYYGGVDGRTGWDGFFFIENHYPCDNLNGPIGSRTAKCYLDSIAFGDSYIGPLAVAAPGRPMFRTGSMETVGRAGR